jgi:hypothetical protein
MTKLTWQVNAYVNGVNTQIQNKVLSINITQGRDTYLDTYSGGTCRITINNAGDYASGIAYGSLVRIYDDNTGFFDINFWVQEIDFHDYPSNTGLNTATIVCADWMSRAGRILANNFSLVTESCEIQAARFKDINGGPLPPDMDVSIPSLGSSTAAAITYTGSVNNYFNLLINTERGYFTNRQFKLNFVTRNLVSSYAPIATTFGRTTSSTQIAYQTFDRIQNGVQFVNTATVQPTGLAEQTSVNSASVSTYGAASYSSASVDNSTTQALGSASWIANNLSDPSSLRFKCSFSDVAQNATALDSWFTECWGTFNRTSSLFYQVPGGSLTSANVVLEGYTINITTEQTTFDLSFSPLQYYQFFTLDSTTLGILDTSRLGW